MAEKLYKLAAPIGNIMIPKQFMTQKELRDFALQLIQEPSQVETWREKIQKDGIESVVEWLEQAGYTVTPQ